MTRPLSPIIQAMKKYYWLNRWTMKLMG